MGIIHPRPAMRRAEARRVVENLKLHARLMGEYEAEGLTRAEASKKAFDQMDASRKPSPWSTGSAS